MHKIMNKGKGQLIVALDVDTFEEARRLVDLLKDDIGIFKVGSQIFMACGPEIVRYLIQARKKVFLDLKFHDIPNTVSCSTSGAIVLSASSLSKQVGGSLEEYPGLFMMTVHTAGGKEMLEAAVSAAREQAEKSKVKKPLLVGVTVLTSEEKMDNIHKLVLESAQLAKKVGLDGVVASSQEAAIIRKNLGDDFIIVTPGIRPKGSEPGDQKRVATPAEAIANGSDFLVVGRPVVKAENPSEVVKQILKDIKWVKQ
jgi:orotidine-5'-phosphate decarboxylase